MTEIGIGLQEPFQIYLKGKRWIVQSDEACNATGDGLDANQITKEEFLRNLPRKILNVPNPTFRVCIIGRKRIKKI